MIEKICSQLINMNKELEFVNTTSDQKLKDFLLNAICSLLVKRNDLKKAREMTNAAVDPKLRDSILEVICHKLIRGKLLDDAHEIANTVSDQKLKDNVFREILLSRHMAKATGPRRMNFSEEFESL